MTSVQNTFRVTHEGAINTFNNLLSKEIWQDVYHATDVESKYNAFYDKLQFYFNISCPMKTTKLYKYKKTWVTEEVKSSSNSLKDLYSLSKSYPELKPLYRQKNISTKFLLRQQKVSFILTRSLNLLPKTKPHGLS
uniref:Uncharacterized protein LOC114342140 n=1 Tax=Diabrotica virgifera virgifera TaxID=50390 RepID=A0A6P7GY67_DIAVI